MPKSIDEIFVKIKETDKDFRRRARVHPDHIQHGSGKRALGEALYLLCNQNSWPEISGPRVWEVSPTYWYKP